MTAGRISLLAIGAALCIASVPLVVPGAGLWLFGKWLMKRRRTKPTKEG